MKVWWQKEGWHGRQLSNDSVMWRIRLLLTAWQHANRWHHDDDAYDDDLSFLMNLCKMARCPYTFGHNTLLHLCCYMLCYIVTQTTNQQHFLINKGLLIRPVSLDPQRIFLKEWRGNNLKTKQNFPICQAFKAKEIIWLNSKWCWLYAVGRLF